MPKIFIKQVVGRDKQTYNIYKVVNMLGQSYHVAESTKPYGVDKRAATESELTNLLNRAVEDAYTVKPGKIISNDKKQVR